MIDQNFRFEYHPGTIIYGSNCVKNLSSELENIGCNRALIVTGETVGTIKTVIGPVGEGIGSRLAGTYAQTTPQKRLTTALEGAQRIRDEEIDVIVSLGSGSSLDVAKIMSIIAAGNRPNKAIRKAFREHHTIKMPAEKLIPIIAVPTTLAGADFSSAAGITDTNDKVIYGGAFNEQLMPTACFYDPVLFQHTPQNVLCASAMNGFDKGIESLYARNASPVTDSTAMRGLSLLAKGLPRLGAGKRDKQTLHNVVVGIILVQYGVSQVRGTTLSLIHAFGHGLTRGFGIQQGAAHAIMAPHVLKFLFENVDGRRRLIAKALNVSSSDDAKETATAIVDKVASIRDNLSLPSRLRSIDTIHKNDLPEIASAVYKDGIMRNAPDDLDPQPADLEAILEAAW